MHKLTRESDEQVCSCGLRWDIGEDDPHPARTAVTKLTECYQCSRGEAYLFADGRCGKCTRLTPEEIRGDCE